MEPMDRKISPPTWSLETKVGLTERVLGIPRRQPALRGNMMERLVDSTLLKAFRRIIPVHPEHEADSKWAELLEGYNRVGLVNRHIGRLPVVGDRVVQWVSRSIGRMTVRNRFWEISPEACRDLVSIAREYLKFAEGIGLRIDYDRCRADEDAVTLYVSHCSAGVQLGYPRGTCYAMNEMDREVIRLLGGRLHTPETIAENGKYCCFRITR